MIAQIEITGIKYDVDAPLKAYIGKKIGRLDRFLPRHARKSASAEVRIRLANQAHGNKYECDVTLHLPDHQINATDTTMNAFAAVDIVEEKLKNQLKKYKELHIISRKGKHHGILRRMKARLARSDGLGDLQQ